MLAMATERIAIASVVDVEATAPAVARLSHAIVDARWRAIGYPFAKRLIDVVAAAVLLVLLLPVFAAIAIAIRLDSPGPVFYRAERIGRFGKPFIVLKFRSMKAGCPATPHVEFVKTLLRAGMACELYKVTADARVTRVGAFLRRTSMDELPQLWNVLAGDMSLVGPRPDVAYAVAEYADWMHRRLDVKPGITGLWQVSGRSKLGLLDMYRLDVAYASAPSLREDVRILLRTVPVVLTRDGAL
jgi:lipopolysaccharide/colanic/teichoic acid biosynthesis glycosyltransferase